MGATSESGAADDSCCHPGRRKCGSEAASCRRAGTQLSRGYFRHGRLEHGSRKSVLRRGLAPAPARALRHRRRPVTGITKDSARSRIEPRPTRDGDGLQVLLGRRHSHESGPFQHARITRSPGTAVGSLDHQVCLQPSSRSSRAWNGRRKVLLRKLGKRILPPALDITRKQGFAIPLDRWFRGNWGTYMCDVLSEADPHLFNQATVNSFVLGQRKGRVNSQRIFCADDVRALEARVQRHFLKLDERTCVFSGLYNNSYKQQCTFFTRFMLTSRPIAWGIRSCPCPRPPKDSFVRATGSPCSRRIRISTRISTSK